jgi:hypothetical protein
VQKAETDDERDITPSTTRASHGSHGRQEGVCWSCGPRSPVLIDKAGCKYIIQRIHNSPREWETTGPRAGPRAI